MALHDHQSLELPGDQFLRGLTGLMAPRQLSDAQMPIDAEAGSRMLRKLSTSLRASQLSPDAMQEAGKLIIKNGFKSVYQRSSCRSSEKKAADVLTSRSLVSRSLEGLGRAFRVFPRLAGQPFLVDFARFCLEAPLPSVLCLSHLCRLQRFPLQVETTFTTHFLEKTPRAEVGPPGHGSSAE